MSEGGWRNRSQSSWGLSVCLSVYLCGGWYRWSGRVSGFQSCLAIKIQGTSRATHGSSLEISEIPLPKFLHLGGRRTNTRPWTQSRPEYNTKHRGRVSALQKPRAICLPSNPVGWQRKAQPRRLIC